MYDIEGFVSRYFPDYKYYGNPTTDLSVCCPFCEERGSGEDTKYHLQIHLNSDKQVVHCFRCGYASNWITFVMNVAGMSYIQAVGEIYVTPKIRGDTKSKLINTWKTTKFDEATKSYYDLPSDFKLLINTTDNRLVREAKKYLIRRWFTEPYWERYKLGVAESIGYRVIIPIERGYWQGRAIYNWLEPKYINPKNPAKDVIFNADALEKYDEIVVCEGAFSAMAVGDNAVALIGKEPTNDKIHRLLNTNVQFFIIALEERAFPTMGKLADALIRDGRSVTIWSYMGGDPADYVIPEKSVYDLKTKLSLLLK